MVFSVAYYEHVISDGVLLISLFIALAEKKQKCPARTPLNHEQDSFNYEK